MLCVEHDNIEIFCFWMFDESKLERALASSSLHWVTAEILFYFGRLTLVWWRPMKSLPSICPSVTKFSQDWIISFLILYVMIADHDILWLTEPDFRKKVWWPKFGPNVVPKLDFFSIFSSLFNQFSFKLHTMIACNNVFVLVGKKPTKKILGAQIWTKQTKIESKTRLLAIFLRLIH